MRLITPLDDISKCFLGDKLLPLPAPSVSIWGVDVRADKMGIERRHSDTVALR